MSKINRDFTNNIWKRKKNAQRPHLIVTPLPVLHVHSYVYTRLCAFQHPQQFWRFIHILPAMLNFEKSAKYLTRELHKYAYVQICVLKKCKLISELVLTCRPRRKKERKRDSVAFKGESRLRAQRGKTVLRIDNVGVAPMIPPTKSIVKIVTLASREVDTPTPNVRSLNGSPNRPDTLVDEYGNADELALSGTSVPCRVLSSLLLVGVCALVTFRPSSYLRTTTVWYGLDHAGVQPR